MKTNITLPMMTREVIRLLSQEQLYFHFPFIYGQSFRIEKTETLDELSHHVIPTFEVPQVLPTETYREEFNGIVLLGWCVKDEFWFTPIRLPKVGYFP